MNHFYNACIYARLSRDDGDKLESDSITNQKSLIRDYLSKHPEIREVSEKVDDGYSGVNFDRPAFQEMMDDIRSGKVNCVVVKDLSRFGRNYIEAGNYIEKVFPFLGVRFIAINDNYDSLDKNQSDSLVIPFKNLINDAYCKDISVKTRTQLEIKRKKGQFIGAFAVYGYLKDEEDHNKLVPDLYASEVVRMIFKWKMEGMSQGSIAEKLNMQGVLCPMEYKLSLGMKVQTKFRVHQKAVWAPNSVTRILKNEIYTGVLIQGKCSTPNYKVKKIIQKDESEWIRIENSHPAIIDRDVFDMALDGMRPTEIARVLNERKVETPSEYYRRKHPKSTKFGNTSKLSCWNHNTIRKILQQEMYYGAVAGHKRQGISVGSKQTRAVPKDERIIVEGMHEGIVTKEEFLEVQKIFVKHGETKIIVDKNYPLHRKVKCGTCGRAMTFKQNFYHGTEYRYISCPHAKTQISNGCNGKYHKEEDLNAIVWEAVKKLFDLVQAAEEKIVSVRECNSRTSADLEKQMIVLQRAKEKNESDRLKNMEMFMSEEITMEVYKSYRKTLADAHEQLDMEIRNLEEQIEAVKNVNTTEVADTVKLVKKYMKDEQLTKQMVQELIEKVVVYDSEHVEIAWKFKDEILK